MSDGARANPAPPDGASVNSERTALKEWAVLCDALADGEIVALVRKGGIREQRAGFAVRHDRFLLYPTWFHEKSAELQPRFASRIAAASAHRPPGGIIRVGLVADVVATWHVRELEPLRAIEPFHGMAWPSVVSRFEYRGVPGVRVIAVRASRLALTHDVPETRRYQGCVSWVALDAAIDVTGATPVLGEADLDARVALLSEALGAPVPASAKDGDGDGHRRRRWRLCVGLASYRVSLETRSTTGDTEGSLAGAELLHPGRTDWGQAGRDHLAHLPQRIAASCGRDLPDAKQAYESRALLGVSRGTRYDPRMLTPVNAFTGAPPAWPFAR